MSSVAAIITEQEEKLIGKELECKAAVVRAFNKPLSIETIKVAPPKAHEVRIKVLHNAMCHTDYYTWSGSDSEVSEDDLPVILGHEGAAIVLDVGEGVTKFKTGDIVIPLYTADCGECKLCKSGKTNLCNSVRATQGKGLMPDGTTRFTDKDGKPIKHFMGCSTFSQYSVVADVSLVKIEQADAKKVLDKICLLGCGVTTGVGSVTHVAKAEKDSIAAVFGLGAVGLAVVDGLRMSGAKKIFAVDVSEAKKPLAEKWGGDAVIFVNPAKIEGGNIAQWLVNETDGGCDYTFDCTGNVKVMRSALEACHKGWGTSIIIGVAAAGQEISTRPFQLVTGRVWKGAAFGGVKGRELPGMVQNYLDGEMKLDEYITGSRPFEEVNKAFDDLHDNSKVTLRTVVNLWD